VVNRGIPGNQTHEYLDRFERDVIGLHPRAVIIWGVDNDVIRAPQGRTAEACWCVERNLESLVRLARVHGIEPILVTDLTIPPPARPDRRRLPRHRRLRHPAPRSLARLKTRRPRLRAWSPKKETAGAPCGAPAGRT